MLQRGRHWLCRGQETEAWGLGLCPWEARPPWETTHTQTGCAKVLAWTKRRLPLTSVSSPGPAVQKGAGPVGSAQQAPSCTGQS